MDVFPQTSTIAQISQCVKVKLPAVKRKVTLRCVFICQNSGDKGARCQAVMQIVKMICRKLHDVETIDISKAVKRLMSVVNNVQVCLDVIVALLLLV